MPYVPVAQLKDYVGKELGRSDWLTIDQARGLDGRHEGGERVNRGRDANNRFHRCAGARRGDGGRGAGRQ